tara:strand:- start:235 stop:552 length:318 start_codon:yes stop_codon:yes gene_type:complete
MKYNRKGLVEDINFISKLNIPPHQQNKMKSELIDMWKYNGKDSPWNNEEERVKKEKEAVETLISISNNGVSSEWCGEHIIFNNVETKKPTVQKKYNLRSSNKKIQ